MKELKLNKKTKEINIMMEILYDYFDEEDVSYSEDIECISFPLGMIVFISEEKVWCFEIDFTFTNDKKLSIILMMILNDISKNKITLEIGNGYQSCYDKNNICTGLVFQDDIYDLMKEKEMSEKEAEKILKKNLKENKND
jgi:hypothetical protein